jgi:hypothetical protein
MAAPTGPKPASPSAFLEMPYVLDSITRSPSPIADDTRDWHTYVIGHGDNKIVGRRPGNAETVRRAAEELVMRFNERRSFRPGSKQLLLTRSEKT